MAKLSSQNPSINKQCKTSTYEETVIACLQGMTGNANATLILLRAFFWTDKRHAVIDGRGWIAKSTDEWAAETGLTPRQVKDALKRLRRLGLIETRQTWFGHGRRINHLRLSNAAVCRIIEYCPSQADRFEKHYGDVKPSSQGTQMEPLWGPKCAPLGDANASSVINDVKNKDEKSKTGSQEGVAVGDSLSETPPQKIFKPKSEGEEGKGSKGESKPKAGENSAASENNFTGNTGSLSQAIYTAFLKGREESGAPYLGTLGDAEKKALKLAFAKLPETVSQAVRLTMLETIATSWQWVCDQMQAEKWGGYEITFPCSPFQLVQGDHLDIICRSELFSFQARLILRGVALPSDVTEAQLTALESLMTRMGYWQLSMTNAEIEAFIASGETEIPENTSMIWNTDQGSFIDIAETYEVT